MTCIVGLVHDGVTYIGGDSLGSNGYSGTVRKDMKVFHLKDVANTVLGYTSSFRMGQLLMYAKGLIDPRDIRDKKLDHEYLVTEFIPNVQKLFETGGYSKNNNGEKRGGEFLFAHKDRLFKIEGDFQVGESVDNYDACGSGEMFALGSLHTTAESSIAPIERVRMALQAATKFSVGVQPPFYIGNTKDYEIIKYGE